MFFLKFSPLTARALPLLIGCMLCTNALADTILYKDAKQPIEKRVKDLLQRMTLE